MLYLHTDHKAVRDSYNALLENLSGKIDATREDVKIMTEQIISINFTRALPGVGPPDIPLDPKRKDYPDVQFWSLESWSKIRRGAGTIDSDSPILSIFFEDEFGVAIPKGVKDAVRNDVTSFWDGMYNGGRGEIPQTWNKTGLTRKEEFRTTLEGKYPWLRLCEGNWKANHLWINYFTRWKNSRFWSPAAKKAPANPPDRSDGMPIIEIETSDSDSSVGSKRQREDLIEPMPSKRPRAQQAEKPVAPPARPQAKKTSAKVAKVGELSYPLDEHSLKAF